MSFEIANPFKAVDPKVLEKRIAEQKEHQRKERERVAAMRIECDRAFGKGTKIYHTSAGQRVETRQLEVVTK